MDNRELAQAALRYIDEHGLEVFSFRKLSEATSVPTMTIKNRFGSKDALLRAVLAEMLAETPLEIPEEPEKWDESLRRVAHHNRDMALAHPNVFPLFLMVPAFESPMRENTERVFSTHVGQDIPKDIPYTFLSIMHSFLSGFQMAERFSNQADKANLDEGGRRLAEMFTAETFDRNLDIIIAGLAAQYDLPLE